MPQDPSAALSALLRSSSIEDHDEILKAANALIKAKKGDVTSHHTRVVALLHLDRFEDALRAIDEGGAELQAACALEKAYALYKTGKLDDATEVLKAAGDGKRAITHLAAQVAYRAEKFDEAGSVSRKLLDQAPEDEENDLNINIKAAAAQPAWQGTAPPPPAKDEQLDTFMLCYNTACSHIGRGEFGHASELLQRASKLCDASDDLDAEDKQAEMQPILAQQAYVYARIGKLKESLDLYKSLGHDADNDIDLDLILENNKSALEVGSENPYLLQRKAASWANRGKEAKLFKYQSDVLYRNNLVIELQAQKIPGVQERTAKTLREAQHPSTLSAVNSLSVIHAAAATHGKSGKQLTRSLREISLQRPNDVGLILTIIQIQARQKNHGAALATLEAFLTRLEKEEDEGAANARFSAGLVALNVCLMRAQGRENSAKSELAKAAEYWKDRPVDTSTSVLREAGIELLRSSKSEDLKLAGHTFQKLLSEDQESSVITAGIVASLAPFDLKKAEQYLGELPCVEDLIEAVNVDKLIGAGVAQAPRSNTVTKRTAPEDSDKKPAKRRRTRKLPKSYEEGKTPDPERWLPLRDRSSYRPKGKKGKKKAAESTQGGMVKEEEKLGLVGGGDVKVERAPAAGSSNKKKKKGKK